MLNCVNSKTTTKSTLNHDFKLIKFFAKRKVLNTKPNVRKLQKYILVCFYLMDSKCGFVILEDERSFRLLWSFDINDLCDFFSLRFATKWFSNFTMDDFYEWSVIFSVCLIDGWSILSACVRETVCDQNRFNRFSICVSWSCERQTRTQTHTSNTPILLKTFFCFAYFEFSIFKWNNNFAIIIRKKHTHTWIATQKKRELGYIITV